MPNPTHRLMWLALKIYGALLLTEEIVSPFYPEVCTVRVSTVAFDGRIWVNSRERILLWNPLAECLTEKRARG